MQLQVVSNPLSMSLPDLRSATVQLRMGTAGSKAELILRLLKRFDLAQPCSVPAIVLLHVREEKWLPASDSLEGAVHALKLAPLVRKPMSAFKARQLLTKSVSTPAGLTEAINAAIAHQHELEQELQAAQQTLTVLQQARDKASTRLSQLDKECKAYDPDHKVQHFGAYGYYGYGYGL